ncbi:unnamed protein product [Triticum turgidum subsp. durum]|uniref:K Homology domain-containing protein n=1 Tax=Triticum turgidum subsp. durum TaxID=4567 RepID=A0A9R0UYF0_TRITD|nr:unnamed protein product [Triticum turgidum subsp. durum]
MDERIPPPPFFQYSPSGVHSSPHHHNPMRSSASERERYIAELLAERQKLVPFLQVLPFCNRLLNQECVISLVPPYRYFGIPNDGIHHMGIHHSPSMGWNGGPGVVGGPVVKKLVRMDVPAEKYPNFNFVGRLLGPRGNSLKRVEATTQCRVYIRGRGSVKDTVKENKLRAKPGYEHLNEPLHVLIEAEFPADIVDARLNQAVVILEDLLKPVDESMDYFKKQQLRELAILNGTLREEESPSPSPHLSPSVSPFNSTGMKRAKTGR